VMDGLRRDMVTPALAPNLHRFMAEGCDFINSRAIFPTSTRVNATALGTGACAGTHGIVANEFFDPRVFDDKLIHTGKSDHLDAAEVAYGGKLLTTPSLGELVAAGGGSVAVVSTASGGTTRLLNVKARTLGHVTLCLRDWPSSTPGDLADELVGRYGPIPPAERPNAPRIRLQTDMFLDVVFPRFEPDLSIVWYSDPDSTYHYCGIGSAQSHAAIRNVDAEFGRLIAWWRSSGLRERMQVFVVSDHGHITAERRVDAKGALNAAGLSFDSHFMNGATFAGKASYTGYIWVRDGDSAQQVAIVDWLHRQPWCGLVFSPGGDGAEGGVPGTLDRTLLMTDHERAPDVTYVMRNFDKADAYGLPGTCYFDNDVPDGGSVHAGLHPSELCNVLCAQGTQFRAGARIAAPAGIIDVAPTILHLFGMAPPPEMDGRVLHEALSGADGTEPEFETREVSVARPDGHAQTVRFSSVGRTRYLDAGWVG